MVPFALISNFELTTSSGKHLEVFSHVLIVPLTYKLITSSRGIDKLCIGFDRDPKWRRDELTRNKKMKGNYPVKNMLKYVFGFAEHQNKILMASVIN